MKRWSSKLMPTGKRRSRENSFQPPSSINHPPSSIHPHKHCPKLWHDLQKFTFTLQSPSATVKEDTSSKLPNGGEATARERGWSYQARPAPLFCWQVFSKSVAPTSWGMRCQTHSSQGSTRRTQNQHEAERDGVLWQRKELCTRAGAKKDNQGPAFSRKRVFQYDSPTPARTLHSSKYFQISQTHSAWDQNERVLWFINYDWKYFYSPHLVGVFVGTGRRQKMAICKLMGLKASHSTQWPLNTLLFRREPWKGRNEPAGVTNGSMLGTVNPNRLVRVISKYFRPFFSGANGQR